MNDEKPMRRVVVIGGRGHSKTLAMIAQMEAAHARAVKVSIEQLSEDRGPLTGDELRHIMETPPDMSHVDRQAQTRGGFDRRHIRRYTK